MLFFSAACVCSRILAFLPLCRFCFDAYLTFHFLIYFGVFSQKEIKTDFEK